MKLTGMVDERTLAKYEREAKEKNRESWYDLTSRLVIQFPSLSSYAILENN